MMMEGGGRRGDGTNAGLENDGPNSGVGKHNGTTGGYSHNLFQYTSENRWTFIVLKDFSRLTLLV